MKKPPNDQSEFRSEVASLLRLEGKRRPLYKSIGELSTVLYEIAETKVQLAETEKSLRSDQAPLWDMLKDDSLPEERVSGIMNNPSLMDFIAKQVLVKRIPKMNAVRQNKAEEKKAYMYKLARKVQRENRRLTSVNGIAMKVREILKKNSQQDDASQLVMAGVDLTTVKELLGHKDIKMTLRYAHLAPAHKRNAVNVIDTLLNPSPNCTPATNCTITAQETEKELACIS